MQTRLTEHAGTREAAIAAFIPLHLRFQERAELKKEFQCEFTDSAVERWQKIGRKEA